MAIDQMHTWQKLGVCLEVNEAFVKLFGYNLKDTHKLQNWFRRAFPEPGYRKKVIHGWLRDIRWARRNGGVMPVAEDRVRTKNGQEVLVEVGGVILGDYLLTTFVDLTKRVKAEQRLAQSEALFRTIFENLPTPAAHVDLDRKYYGDSPVFFMNQAVHRTFGYSKKELPNVEAWMTKAYPDPKYRKEMHDKLFGSIYRLKNVGDIVPPMEFRMRCKDGSEKHMLWTGFKMPRGWLALSTDLTEVRKAEAELRTRAKKEAERLQQKLQTSVVASAVAHEVNQPLSEILMKSQLALQRAESVAALDPQIHATLEGILEDARRVEKTIERMRALLRNVPTEQISLDLRDVVDSSLLYLRRLVKEAGIGLEVCLPVKPVLILGDASQLQLAVSNLLRNAVEAIRESSGKLHRIKVRLGIRGSHAEIKVGDSGPGLDPAIRDQIFSPLASTRVKGTGLGLYLVKTTVMNHGGQVSVGTSALGGAEFVIRIPLPKKDSKNQGIPG